MHSKRIRDIAFIAHRYIGLVVGILAAAIALIGSPIAGDKVTVTLAGKPLSDKIHCG